MENLGYQLFRSIEKAKVALSDQDETTLSFHEARIDLDVKITRKQFETFTEPLRDKLEVTVDDVLRRTGTRNELDAVFLTGGTSYIPSVRKLFETKFGAEKIRTADAFTSVSEGLGRAAAGASGRYA